jgi:hypothetical protein
MKHKIIDDDDEESLDELVKRARSDKELKKLMHQPESDVLIYASGSNISMYWHGRHFLLQSMPDRINKLVLHKDHLYFNYLDRVGRLFDDQEVKYDFGFVTALCSHNDKMYGSIHDVQGYYVKHMAGKERYEFQTKIKALCSYKGKLLAGDQAGKIFDVMSGEIIVEHRKQITALFVYEDCLYSARDNEIWVTVPQTTERMITDDQRPDNVWAIASYNGRLIDAGLYGIFDTRKNERVGIFPKIDAMTVQQSNADISR